MKVIFVFLFLFSLLKLDGQTNFRPGYIITNENDTIKGLVDLRGDARNSKKCDFKENESAVAKEYLPFSIKGYRFADGKFYISKKVKYKGEDIELFLEFLVKGIFNLYFYTEGVDLHYFIEKTDGNLLELTNAQRQLIINEVTYSRESKDYIGQLKYALADCPQIYSLIDQAGFNNKSLIEITRKYHDYVCHDGKCIIYEKQLPGIKVKFGPFISVNSSSLKFKYSPMYAAIHFDETAYPTIGLLLNASLPRLNEKLSFQASAEFGKSYFHGVGTSPYTSSFEEVHLHTSTLKVKGGLKYTYPKGKIRPTLMIGANVLKIMNSNGRRVEEALRDLVIYTTEINDVPIPNILVGFNVDLGVDYHLSSSFIVFCNLGYDSSNGTNSEMFTSLINTVSFHAGIYF